MRRFLFHHTADTVPAVSVDWECVEFSNKQIAVSLAQAILHFWTLDAMQAQFGPHGTVEIEWIDDDEETASDPHYSSDGNSYLAPLEAIDVIVDGVTLLSQKPTDEVSP